MSKAIIHQFDPQIYPRLLWVVIGEKKGSAISDRFDNIPDMDESTDADVNHAYDKISKKGGILIRFESKKAARSYSIVAHEASTLLCAYSTISGQSLMSIIRSRFLILWDGFADAFARRCERICHPNIYSCHIHAVDRQLLNAPFAFEC